jgi:regulator of protease activity HflC (stomatin/prohibitin superfamily)
METEQSSSKTEKAREKIQAARSALDRETRQFGAKLRGKKKTLLALATAGLIAYAGIAHPPFADIGHGETGLRTNQWTGVAEQFSPGSVLVVPGVHTLRIFSLRDTLYRPKKSNPDAMLFQSVEGLPLGVDFTLRYALDPETILSKGRLLPQDIFGEVVLPTVQDVFHRTLSRHTVREIFSSKRGEIQEAVTRELSQRLAADGIDLKLLSIGQIDLPDDYKAGMEKMLEAEMENERMRYTLELKAKEVKESELSAEADKVRREKEAEATAQEQVIAAQAQAEAMKHILPFKEKQIQQRALEAEAAKVVRVKQAEAEAQARRIEAAGEADARKKLAEAEAWRLDQVGRVDSAQMAREGAVLSAHPVLVQKLMAEKLSDKIQVVIVPAGKDGAFLGENLIGRLPPPQAAKAQQGPQGGNGDEEAEGE